MQRIALAGLVLVALASMSVRANPGPMTFGNVSFDPGTLWNDVD